MNPVHMNARVVMPSQMFGIVEIHVGAGFKPAPADSNPRGDAAAVGGP